MNAKSKMRTSTAVNRQEASKNKYAAYGWYWHPTPRIHYLINGLSLRGINVNVWTTPQIDAVCWLLNIDVFPLPAESDETIYELFCNVAALKMNFGRTAPSLSEVQTAAKEARRTSQSLKRAIHMLEGASPALEGFVTDFSMESYKKLKEALSAVEQFEVFLGGLADIPMKTSSKFIPESHNKTGRTRNWVAEIVAMKCADIYRTTFGAPPSPGDGHPPFRTFLERFSVGFPDAERADKRALARAVQRDGYTGEMLTPR
jgi:hypothetical protein